MTDSFAAHAEEFADELRVTLSRFYDRPIEVQATTSGTRITIRPAEDGDLALVVQGRRLLSLDFLYRCQFDHTNNYLAIHTSEVKVFAGPKPKGAPLFQYDYVRDQKSHLPSAHFQVHAHRDEFTQAMTLAAVARAKHRQLGRDGDFKSARLSSIHFPVGGSRFRPCLEDVLQMLATEFGVETPVGWRQQLELSRERYRRRQAGAVVRDCPSEAARVLRSLGYEVSPPRDGQLADRPDRLRAI